MLSLFDVLDLTEEGRKEVKRWSAKSKAQIVLERPLKNSISHANIN